MILRDVYAEKAIVQIPRLLTLQDRNPYSPTYGCFHRDYWLYKTSDFPDAVRQFGTQALALVYKYDFPGNIYKGNGKIRDWAIAGLDFWAQIQHGDGSFDEFYPYERGWVGPTAFTTYSSIEAYNILKDEIPDHVASRLLRAFDKAARFIGMGEAEEDHLANHHAMACLALWKAHELLEDEGLRLAYERAWEVFSRYHNDDEGWSREYDGVDPGYLSATVSFLSKIYQSNKDGRILEVLRESVDFCSYFVYPNGFYAGSTGSRNTMHFYPHGFEIMAPILPMAGSVAEKMLQSLAESKLVPPEIMSDRYVFYRVPEFLQAYLDYEPRCNDLPKLPYQGGDFNQYHPQARIFAAKLAKYYVVANLAKGGVVKAFDCQTGQLLLHDSGLIGELSDGRVITSQWIDPAFISGANGNEWRVSGQLQEFPTHKLFSPLKMVLFRCVLIALGWNPRLSHLIKKKIRKVLMLNSRSVPINFSRRFRMEDSGMTIVDELQLKGGMSITRLSIGDEFFVRYVPQSRFFQEQELKSFVYALDVAQLNAVNGGEPFVISRQFPTSHVITGENTGGHSRSGIYGLDYFKGRNQSPDLKYRLRRRTDEVERALRRHAKGGMEVIVDVGTADGLMLDSLAERIGRRTYVGIDLSKELLATNHNSDVIKIKADALHLPIRSEKSDVVIATAVIEHVSDANAMLVECARILRKDGLLVLTTPDPFMEMISSRVGLLKEAGHQRTFKLGQLAKMIEENGFALVEAKKFMFSPIGFPGERMLERIFGPIGLRFVMANQLVVARKT